MHAFTVTLIVILAVFCLLVLVGLPAMFFIFFFSPKFDRKNPKPDLLMGKELPRFIKETDKQTEIIKRAYPFESVSVFSDDALRLSGDFYINTVPTDITVICVHGYNTCGYYDFALMVEPILQHGYNCLLIDQRHYGKSEGRFTEWTFPSFW